jgi:NADH dehydrogenase FAD-containing subunit
MGNSQVQPKHSQTVIVVGGGYVGCTVAKLLDAKFKVIVVDPHDAVHHKVAALRSAVVPGWEKRARIPRDRLLKFGRVIHAEVVSVTSGAVTLKDGTTLDADYVVLCHGDLGATHFPAGPKRDVFDSKGTMEALRQMQQQIRAARSVLVVGGGPVGCELVGEIRAQYPSKSIKLVHSQGSLLSNANPPITPTATFKLLELLRSINIEVILNTRIMNLPSSEDGVIVGEHEYTLSDGSVITADLCLICFSASTSGVRNLVDNVDSANRVIVDDFLRVPGFHNVFCCGDANNHRETKLAYTGGAQGRHTVKNIELLHEHKELVPYVGMDGGKNQYGAMFVPVGPKLGVGAFNTQVFGNYMVSLLKGKGLLSKRVFNEYNAPLPAVVAV